MAKYLGREWKKEELRSYFSDITAAAGAVPFTYSDGKGEGVRAVEMHTGSGLQLTVLPGRGMDIHDCRYKGLPLQFFSSTGMTSPAYYEEPGVRWLRSFFGGLLATCGITYCGAPCTDQGKELGLHGRIANAAAEQVSVNQDWEGDEYVISVAGKLREASVMGENLLLTRTVTSRLGSAGFTLEDVVENRGFEPQPLMLMYHFNFGFPLLSETARVAAPFASTIPRDAQAEADNGIAEHDRFTAPQRRYMEKVFYHDNACGDDGRTFAALVNEEAPGGPLGIVLRYSKHELPEFTQWKMMNKDCYVCGLEPGTAKSTNRAAVREEGKLQMLEPQEIRRFTIDFEVLDTLEQIKQVQKQAEEIRAGYGR